jgi:hypothetical protein
MPARAKRSLDGEVVVVGGFVLCLSLAVSILAQVILSDTKRSLVPVHPRNLEVRDLASVEAESARDETDKSRLKPLWR